MGWHQFKYIFDKKVENAMRYSMKEAFRRQCQRAGGANSDEIIDDAVETFKRKMETHTVGQTSAESKEQA
jgi:ribosomal protein S21